MEIKMVQLLKHNNSGFFVYKNRNIPYIEIDLKVIFIILFHSYINNQKIFKKITLEIR